MFRSAWGLRGLRATPGRALAGVRAAGFDGLEASLNDLGDTADERAAALAAARDEGLSLILSAYSSWPDYEGPADDQLGKSSGEHLSTLTRELEQVLRDPFHLPRTLSITKPARPPQIAALCARAGRLSPVSRVNAHSGSDAWSEDVSADFLSGALAAATSVGGDLPPVSHETHRGRILCCPFLTARLLRRVPQVRTVSD